MADTKAELTLIVGNLPTNISRDEVMSWLAASGYDDSYDFLYVPLCFKTNSNKGYMFINFMERETARRFAASFHGVATGSGSAQLIVRPSATQGIEASISKLRKSSSRRIKNPQAWPYLRHRADPESSTMGEAPARLPVRPPPRLRPEGCDGPAASALWLRPGRFEGASVAPSVDDVGRAAAATPWAFTSRGPGELAGAAAGGSQGSAHRRPRLGGGHAGSGASTASSAAGSSSAARPCRLGASPAPVVESAPEGLPLRCPGPPGLFRGAAASFSL
ncbi:unnamed protein product [Prorocentrum cordatum]|uniref:RRM domain-containing protein n=1 Tax=Prorocentrum cordatum TaxID=2364126 RepID=A0ABN9SXH0_9DINO|nr:unnamed protein product [Polarella glacialis]